MTVWLATRTKAAIDAAICADGGNKYRGYLGMVLPTLEDPYRSNEEDRRSHLGASVIGGECERSIFYGFRWASTGKVRGKKGEPKLEAESRMRRLWNRGHLEEGRFIALLLSAGIQVYQRAEGGGQFRISALGGHFSGSTDGILLGVPDLPVGIPCLAEMKTHSADSFEKLEEVGVEKAKPTHYVQMQEYMHGQGLVYALYIAVNKNTDQLYCEIVRYDRAVSEEFLERAKRIIFSGSAPPRMRGANPGFFMCKYMCDHTDVCYSTVAPQRSCRTCSKVHFADDGTVICLAELANTGGEVLSKKAQIAGCGVYQLDLKLQ
jgi:hypothetical protein